MNSSSCCLHDRGGHGWGLQRTRPCVQEHTLHGDEVHSVPCWGSGEKKERVYCQTTAFIWQTETNSNTRQGRCSGETEEGSRLTRLRPGFTMFQVRGQWKNWIFFSFLLSMLEIIFGVFRKTQKENKKYCDPHHLKKNSRKPKRFTRIYVFTGFCVMVVLFLRALALFLFLPPCLSFSSLLSPSFLLFFFLPLLFTLVSSHMPLSLPADSLLLQWSGPGGKQASQPGLPPTAEPAQRPPTHTECGWSTAGWKLALYPWWADAGFEL